MESVVFVDSLGIIAMVGGVLPFILPTIFRVLEKMFKRELDRQEKRDIIMMISGAVVITIEVVTYDFTSNTIPSFLGFILVNFVIVQGMVKSVYEGFIKRIERLDTAL